MNKWYGIEKNLETEVNKEIFGNHLFYAPLR